MTTVPGHIIGAAETVLAGVPAYVWDGERLPVPIEEIVDSCYCLYVRDVYDMATAPGAPALALANRSPACCYPPAARSGSTPTRPASGHRGGASPSATSSATG